MKVKVTFLREVRVILLHHSVQFGSLASVALIIKSEITLTNVLCYSHNSQAYCKENVKLKFYVSLR